MYVLPGHTHIYIYIHIHGCSLSSRAELKCRIGGQGPQVLDCMNFVISCLVYTVHGDITCKLWNHCRVGSNLVWHIQYRFMNAHTCKILPSSSWPIRFLSSVLISFI